MKEWKYGHPLPSQVLSNKNGGKLAPLVAPEAASIPPEQSDRMYGAEGGWLAGSVRLEAALLAFGLLLLFLRSFMTTSCLCWGQLVLGSTLQQEGGSGGSNAVPPQAHLFSCFHGGHELHSI